IFFAITVKRKAAVEATAIELRARAQSNYYKKEPTESRMALETSKSRRQDREGLKCSAGPICPVRDQYLMASADIVLARPKLSGHSQEFKKTHRSEGSPSPMRPVPGSTVLRRGECSRPGN